MDDEDSITLTSTADSQSYLKGLASKASPARNGFPRQGAMTQVMLKAEKKVLTKLVLGLQALQVFQLRGFVDGQFAQDVESWVANGRRMPSSRK